MKLLQSALALIVFFCGGLDLYVWVAQKADEPDTGRHATE